MHHTTIAPTIPSADEARLAETARVALAAGQKLTTDDLPPIVTRLLMDLLAQTAAGNAVTLVPVEAELTTQQAADLLNVSRPFVIGLVENGTLSARMIGTHRRLSLNDVLSYKAKRFLERERALDEMLAIDQEYGLI
jgi:excisionase family DNA binding protein